MKILTVILVSFGVLCLLSPSLLWILANRPYSEQEDVQVQEFIFLENFDYSHWNNQNDEASKEYTIKARLLRLKDKNFGPVQIALSKEIVMDHPQVFFYQAGKHYAQLQAGQGLPGVDVISEETNFMNSDAIKFTYDPILTNIQGRSLSCDSMTWDKNHKLFEGKGNCRLQLEDRIIQAPLLIVSENLTVWQVPNPL